MKEIEDLIKNVKEIAKRQVAITTVWGTITDIDWSKKTATVKGLSDDLEYYDVLLGLGSVAIKPVEDTRCLIGLIENKETECFLIQADEIELISITTKEGATVELEKDKLLIKNNSGNLNKILSDFMDEVMKIIVVQGTSISVPAVTKIKQRLNNLLK